MWDGLRPLRKDNTGYDLKQLFIGAEGTLGVVTAAVLRLLPDTPRRATALVALPDVEAAVALLPMLRAHSGGLLTTWELVGRQALDLVLAHLPGTRDPFDEPHAWYGLVELAGASDDVDDHLESALAAAVDAGLVVDAVVAGSPAQRASLWALREGVSEAQKIAGTTIKHDVTVPIAALPRFVAEVGPRLRGAAARRTPGDLRPRRRRQPALQPQRSARATTTRCALAAPRLTGVVYDAVAELGGSISAEHGLGVLKRDSAASHKSQVERDLMRAVKQALDPHGLMNPGKLL